MSTETTINWDQAAQRLLQGELGVLPTDTLYGLVALATKPAAVERVYRLRRREPEKPLITLIADASELARLQIEVDERIRELFGKVWPGPVSVIVPVLSSELRYLHRGTDSIAFRVPRKDSLRALLRQVGPVVAPSANLAGENPALTIEAAREYFGDEVFYLDEGMLNAPPSALVDARTTPVTILRPAPGFRV